MVNMGEVNQVEAKVKKKEGGMFVENPRCLDVEVSLKTWPVCRSNFKFTFKENVAPFYVF